MREHKSGIQIFLDVCKKPREAFFGIEECHKCPLFRMKTVAADSEGRIDLVEGTCGFYGNEIWQTTALRPTWCKVKFRAEEVK